MTGRVRLRHLVGAVSRPRAVQSGPGMYLMRGGCAPELTYSITTYHQAPSAGRVGWTWCGEGPRASRKPTGATHLLPEDRQPRMMAKKPRATNGWTPPPTALESTQWKRRRIWEVT
jgi:hypothetical protein